MYGFFPRKTVSSPEEYFAAAMEAKNYVDSFLKQDKDGIHSTELSGAQADNFYEGTAGILHMYIQFWRMDKRQEYVYAIGEITRYLSIHYMDGVTYAKEHGEYVDGMAEAFYTGLAGIGLVLNEVYRHFQDIHAKDTARKIAAYYGKTLHKDGSGIFWSDNAPVFFDGGITLFLIDTCLTYQDEKLLQIIRKSTDYILSKGTSYEDGSLEVDHVKVPFKRKEPNFEFGTAGIGYLFLKTYEVTKSEKYLAAAIACAKYLTNISVKQEKGYLIPYKLGTFDNLFYLGNCHGPVGTAKLFYELYQVTGGEYYYEQIRNLCDGAESLGAPYRQSAGYWNTTCLCCGPAGFVPMYIGLYCIDKNPRWLKLLNGAGEILLGTKTSFLPEKSSHNAAYWELAFDRLHPDKRSRPAGYYTGAAGIAVSLLQLYGFLSAKKTISQMIDTPYLCDCS